MKLRRICPQTTRKAKGADASHPECDHPNRRCRLAQRSRARGNDRPKPVPNLGRDHSGCRGRWPRAPDQSDIGRSSTGMGAQAFAPPMRFGNARRFNAQGWPD
jgi:hypothetical protein